VVTGLLIVDEVILGIDALEAAAFWGAEAGLGKGGVFLSVTAK
jgi:hypothetical protein